MSDYVSYMEEHGHEQLMVFGDASTGLPRCNRHT